MSRGEPIRKRSAVRHKSQHLGYVTTIHYPDRDVVAFSEGSPYFEVAISDLDDHHIVLLQKYKAHWLIYCGKDYDILESQHHFSDQQLHAIAIYAILNRDKPQPVLLELLKSQLAKIV